MRQRKPVLKFFIDQCVPDSAGRALADEGHEVVFLREKIATSTPDPLVAAVAEANDAILVSLDADFRQLARRYGVARRRFRNLSLIKLSCRESRAADRLREAMTLIYHEWQYLGAQRDRRLFLDIGDNVIRTIR